MYTVIKINDDKVFLGNQKGEFLELEHAAFSQMPIIGDKVRVYQKDEEFIASVIQENRDEQVSEENNNETITGIMQMFLGALKSHQDHNGNVNRSFTQLLLTIFMFWCLVGVVSLQLIFFIESVIVFVWRVLVKVIKALNIAEHYSHWNSERKIRNEKRQAERLEMEKLEKTLETEQTRLQILEKEEKAREEFKAEQKAAEKAKEEAAKQVSDKEKEQSAKDSESDVAAIEKVTEKNEEELSLAETLLEGEILPRESQVS